MLRAIAVRLLGDAHGCCRVDGGCCGIAKRAAEHHGRATHDVLCHSQLSEADLAVAPWDCACVVITLTLATGQCCV